MPTDTSARPNDLPLLPDETTIDGPEDLTQWWIDLGGMD